MEFDLKFYISLTPTTRFDGQRYVVGQNGKLLRLKPGPASSDHFRPQGNSVRHLNFWADDIFQNRCQSAVYNVVVKGLIENLHSGRDGVVLACGAHCSGKTFGIIGIGHQNEGIAPRLLKDIFARRHNKASSYKMSCVEFKDNRVFDLLSSSQDRSSTTKDVSMQKIESFEEAKRMLNSAHLKRTTVDDNGISVHVGSFVVTVYSSALLKDRSKLGKIHIIDMAGVGTARVLTEQNHHQSQANKAMLELSMFLDHVRSVNLKRKRCFENPYGHATMPLLKYCHRSFLKRYTALRLICYVRPEAKCMIANLTTLKLGEAIRKVPTTETKLCISHPDDPVDLLQQMTHLQCELLVMEHLRGSTFMGNMSVGKLESLRNMAKDILYAGNKIETRRLDYAEATVLLSVFKEEYQKQAELKKSSHKDMEEIELISNAAAATEPFRTKSFTLIETNLMTKMTEDLRKSMTDVLTPHSAMALDKLWVNFAKESEVTLREQKQVAGQIDTTYKTLVTAIEKTLSVQEDFTKMRTYMSEIQKNRHSKKEESYDSDMNIVVPDEEKFLYRKICKVELELMEAHKNLNLTKKRLKEILAKYAKIKNEIKKRFDEYVNVQKRKERQTKMRGSMSMRIGKSVRNLAAAKSVVVRNPSREYGTPAVTEHG